jgi:hypothetical protein
MSNFGTGWEYGLLQCVLWRAQHGDAVPSQTVLLWLAAIATMALNEVAAIAFDGVAPAKDQLNFQNALSVNRHLATCLLNVCNGHPPSSIATPSRTSRGMRTTLGVSLRITQHSRTTADRLLGREVTSVQFHPP